MTALIQSVNAFVTTIGEISIYRHLPFQSFHTSNLHST